MGENELTQIEMISCKLEEIKNLTRVMSENCLEIRASDLSKYELEKNYTEAQTMTEAIFDLLDYLHKSSITLLEQLYKNMKSQK